MIFDFLHIAQLCADIHYISCVNFVKETMMKYVYQFPLNSVHDKTVPTSLNTNYDFIISQNVWVLCLCEVNK